MRNLIILLISQHFSAYFTVVFVNIAVFSLYLANYAIMNRL